jgi:hypothetical protein
MAMTVTDCCRGEILVRGGQFFQELASAHLTRATLGMCFCTMPRIYVGFRVQVSALSQRTAATPVDSIAMVL